MFGSTPGNFSNLTLLPKDSPEGAGSGPERMTLFAVEPRFSLGLKWRRGYEWSVGIGILS